MKTEVRSYVKRDCQYSYAEKLALLIMSFLDGSEIHPTRFAETINTDRQFVHRTICQLSEVLPIVMVERGKWMLLQFAEERYDEWKEK